MNLKILGTVVSILGFGLSMISQHIDKKEITEEVKNEVLKELNKETEG